MDRTSDTAPGEPIDARRENRRNGKSSGGRISRPAPALDGRSGPAPCPPPALQEWLRAREFDACPWYPAPADRAVKVPGRDAWYCGPLRLVRVPLTVPDQSEVRYYLAFRFGSHHRNVVGYWLEVRASTPVVMPPVLPRVTE